MKKPTEAECQEALSKGKSAYVSIAVLEKRAETAEAKLARAKEALKFYADEDSWTIDMLEGSFGDYGSKARQCLAELETEKGEL